MCPQAIAEAAASTNHQHPPELHAFFVAKLSRQPHSLEPLQLRQLYSEAVMRSFC